MENLAWGLQMTVLGMGLVFTLLALLWLLLTIVLKLDKEPEEAKPVEETKAAAEETKAVSAREATTEAAGAQTPAAPTVNGLPADLVAAILVATHQHRQAMRRQAAPLARAVWPGSQLFASRWLAAGRARQTTNWQPRGR
jgi:Na+-transporting methylmalonyl-CoA/oxaloacetate decarboxylase gamma subunit